MPVPFEMAHDVLIDAPAQLVLDYVSNPQSWYFICRTSYLISRTSHVILHMEYSILTLC